MADLDNLQIKISADATSASRQLGILSSRLTALSQTLSTINTGNLNTLSSSISSLSSAVSNFSRNTNQADFTRLARNINQLNSVSVANISTISSALSNLSTSVSGIGNVSTQGTQVAELVTALGRFGGANITRAVANLPRLTSEIVNLITSLSTVPAVSNNVVRLISSLSNFNVASRNVGANATQASKGFRDLKVASHDSANGITKLAVAFGKLYASLFWIKRLGNSLWKSIKSSMGYVETLNYFNKAFGQLGKNAVSELGKAGKESAQAYYDSFIGEAKSVTSEMSGFAIGSTGYLSPTNGSSLGLDPTKLMNYQATYAQMSSSMGVASAQATKLSEVLVKIGADLASVKNLEFEQVWENMASGLVGMSRTLDKYGVNIRNANMQQKLFELGISTNISKLSQNDKALLRTIMLLDATTYAWGDLSQTLDQPANQLRMLQSGFSNLARTIGNIFLPIVSKVLPYINAMVIALQRLANWIAKLFGINFDWGLGGGGGDNEWISQIADDAEEASGAMDDASASAKKLKKSVMGFDELNQLSDNSDSSSGAGGLSGVDAGLLDDAFNTAVDEYLKAWDDAYAKLKNKAQRIADAIIDAFKNGDYEGIGKYISTNLERALDKIPWKKIYKVASNFGKGLAEFLNGLITPNLFDSIGRTIANALNTQVEFVVSFASNLKWGQIGESIASGINSLFRNFNFKKLAQAFNLFAEGLWKMMKEVFANLDWKIIFQGLIDFFSNLDFSGWMLFIITKAPQIISFLSNIGAKIALITTNFGALKGGIEKIGTAFVTFGTKIKGIFTGIQNFLINVDLFGSFGEALKYLSNSISPVTKAFMGLVGVVAEFFAFKNLFQQIGEEGTASFGNIALAVGGATVAFGTLAVAMGSIPFAGIVVGITAVVGAIAGYSKGVREAMDANLGEAIKQSLTLEGGVPVDEYVQGVVDRISNVGDGFAKINDASASLSTTRSNIENTANSIELIETKMKSGVLTTEEGVEQLKEAFKSIQESASKEFKALEETLMLTFGENGALHGVFESLGINTDETMQAVTRAYDNAEQRIEEITKELSTLDPSSPKYSELKQELYDLVGQTDETTEAIKNYKSALDDASNVNWGQLTGEGQIDETYLVNILSDITGAMDTTSREVKTSSDNIKESLENALKNAVTEEDKKAIQDAIDALPEALSSVQVDIDSEGLAVANALQEHYVGRIDEVIANAEAEWEKMPWYKKLVTYGNFDNYAKHAVDDYNENYIKPLSENIDKKFSELGIDGAGWAEDATQKITDSLFNVQKTAQGTSTFMANDYKAVFEEAFAKVKTEVTPKANVLGKDITFGLQEGMKEVGFDTTAKAVKDKIISSTEKEMEIQSPAKSMYPIGNYITLGIIEGFKEKFGEFDTAISNFKENTIKPWFAKDKWTFSGIKEGLSSTFEGAISQIKQIWNRFADTLNEKLNFTIEPISIMGKTVYEGGTLNLGRIPKFAKGGMVEDGLFMANHGELVGQFSNGKTAVANNEQIVAGIKQGVYEAVAMAMSTSNSGSGSYINNTIQIDGETIARAVTKGQNSINRRYNPTMA